MNLELYVLLVGIAALFYAAITRIIQEKLVDKKEMEAVQKESKELNAAYKEASKRNDKAEMDRIMKKQMELLPRMNKIMFKQFKPMAVTLLLFFGFIFLVNTFDPTTPDDITLTLTDNGEDCDDTRGDNIYSGCYVLEDGNEGKWVYTAVALNGESELGRNQTYFFYGYEDSDRYVENGNGEAVVPSTDKILYHKGDTVKLYAIAPPKTTQVRAVLNKGTWFYVDLPFTLPIFNVQRIYQPYWWFILLSVVFGFIVSFALKRIKK